MKIVSSLYFQMPDVQRDAATSGSSVQSLVRSFLSAMVVAVDAPMLARCTDAGNKEKPGSGSDFVFVKQSNSRSPSKYDDIVGPLITFGLACFLSTIALTLNNFSTAISVF